MRGLILVFVFLISIAAWSVESVMPEASANLAAENMVTKNQLAYVVGLVLELPIYSFYLGSPDIRGQAYVPNFVPRMGPQLSYKGYGARMTFSLGIPSREKERRGESDQTNFLFNFYWKQYAINLYYQYFKGFYVAGPFEEISESKPDRYTQFPDAEATHFGVNVYLKSKHNKYGLDTAFDQKKFQRLGGEGWIYVPFYRYWEIDLGEKIIKGSEPDSIDLIPDINGGRFDTLGMTYGYSKTYVWDNYFASGFISLGPGVQLQTYEDSGNEFSKIVLAGKMNAKFAIGKLINDYTVGFNGALDTMYSRIEGTEIYSTMASGEAYINRSF